MAKFTVDTQLFRELGELLVGRESTALVELIKNAYDADARAVVVLGENIDDPVNGQVYIEDNGIGMTLKEFENGFLRIATRVNSAFGWEPAQYLSASPSQSRLGKWIRASGKRPQAT